MTIRYEVEPEFEYPIDIVVWASRIYLAHVCNRLLPPAVVEDTFREARLLYMYDALVRVHDRLLIAATVDIIIHESTCPCSAQHEQALVMALRFLQQGSRQGYTAAMSSVLPDAAVRACTQDMRLIASGLSDIERYWPKTEGSQDHHAPRPPVSNVSRLH